LFNETDHQANFIESDLCHVEQTFEEIFEDEILLLDELDDTHFPHDSLIKALRRYLTIS